MRCLDGLKIETVFLVLCLVFGTVFMFLVPPYQVPDEPFHMYRAYQISQGTLVPERREDGWGGDLPRNLVRTPRYVMGNVYFRPHEKQDLRAFREGFSFPLNKEDTVFRSFSNTALSSPVAYFPQVVAMTIGRLTNMRPLVMLYFGRAITLLFATLLIYYAIRIAPICKLPLMMIALMPMSLHLRASLSHDATTNALAILLIALFLRYAHDPVYRLTASAFAVLLPVAVWLALCKSIYVLIVFLFFMIPVRKASTPMRYFAMGLSIIAIAAVLNMLWTGTVKELYMPSLVGRFASLEEPKQFVMSNPLLFSGMLIENIAQHYRFYVRGSFGILGWLDTWLPMWLALGYYLVFIAIAVLNGRADRPLPLISRLLAVGVAAGSVVLLLTSYFFIAGISGEAVIPATQGRYFLPLLPVLAIALYNAKLATVIPRRVLTGGTYIAVVLTLVYTCFAITKRFYIG